jgi:hypothetical protein
LKNEPLGKIDMKILKVAVALGLAASLSGCLTTNDGDVDVVSMASTLFDQAEVARGTSFDQIGLSSTATMTGVIGARFADPGEGVIIIEEIDSGPPSGNTAPIMKLDERSIMTEKTFQGFAGQLTMEADFGEKTVTGSTSNLGLYEYSSGCLGMGDCETTRLSALDGDLTLFGNIATVGPGFAGFNATLSGVVDGDITLYDNDYAYTASVNLNTGKGGQFLKDEDGRLFARSGLYGTANAGFEDENGMKGEYEIPLEGIMIVEGEVVAGVTD